MQKVQDELTSESVLNAKVREAVLIYIATRYCPCSVVCLLLLLLFSFCVYFVFFYHKIITCDVDYGYQMIMTVIQMRNIALFS